MQEPTTKKNCENLFRGLSMRLHILEHDSCDRINIIGKNKKITTIKIKGIKKDIFSKTLSKGLFNRLNGKFTKENTIIIDNNSIKHIFNN